MATFTLNGQSVEVKIPKTHRKCREGGPAGYPKRFNVSDSCVSWWGDRSPCDYIRKRPNYTAPSVLAEPTWAHPEDYRSIALSDFNSYMPPHFARDDFMPFVNPVGRTGLGGRGLLGKWGGNLAADSSNCDILRWEELPISRNRSW